MMLHTNTLYYTAFVSCESFTLVITATWNLSLGLALEIKCYNCTLFNAIRLWKQFHTHVLKGI